MRDIEITAYAVFEGGRQVGPDYKNVREAIAEGRLAAKRAGCKVVLTKKITTISYYTDIHPPQ